MAIVPDREERQMAAQTAANETTSTGPFYGAPTETVIIDGKSYTGVSVGKGKPPAALEIGMVSPSSGLTITGTERNMAKEREALATGQVTAEYIASRGGINSQGYYNDTPISGQLTAAEQRQVTKPDGTVNTAAMAKILQEKQIAELVAKGMSKAEATSQVSRQYGQYGIGPVSGEPLGVGEIASAQSGLGAGIGTPTGLGTAVGTATGGMVTATDVQKAVADALAKQQAQFDAVLAEQAAAKQAETIATRTKAKDKLTAMLANWNLQGLASWIDEQVTQDVSEEMIFVNLYDQDAYKQRFPGMDALRKQGRVISEEEYTRIENSMIQTARFFDLPNGFYDSPDDFGKLIGNQVSAKEFQDRLQVGQDLARSLNPEVKQELINLYGVGEGDLTAYVLDADRALSLIQKQAKAAQFVGLGRAAGFRLSDMTAQQAEAIVGTEPYSKLTEAQLKTSLGQAGQLRREQQRLSQIEGMTYSEQEALDAVLGANPQALLASQQRAQREVARFGARGGITGSSLRTTETAI